MKNFRTLTLSVLLCLPALSYGENITDKVKGKVKEYAKDYAKKEAKDTIKEKVSGAASSSEETLDKVFDYIEETFSSMSDRFVTMKDKIVEEISQLQKKATAPSVNVNVSPQFVIIHVKVDENLFDKAARCITAEYGAIETNKPASEQLIVKFPLERGTFEVSVTSTYVTAHAKMNESATEKTKKTIMQGAQELPERLAELTFMASSLNFQTIPTVEVSRAKVETNKYNSEIIVTIPRQTAHTVQRTVSINHR